MGSRVKVKDLEFDEEETFLIVGSTEADPDEGKISNESPLGMALLGQKINRGDQSQCTCGHHPVQDH